MENLPVAYGLTRSYKFHYLSYLVISPALTKSDA